MRAHDDTYLALTSVITEDLKTDCPSSNDHYFAMWGKRRKTRDLLFQYDYNNLKIYSCIAIKVLHN